MKLRALAALSAILASSGAVAGDFAEVSLSIQIGASSIAPVAVVELGRTADIQCSLAPDPEADAGNPMPEPGESADAETADHRLLLTVTQEGERGYRADVEYMTRPDANWISQWQPTMLLRPAREGSMELVNPNGPWRIAMTISPRRDVSSLDDLRHAYSHATGIACDTRFLGSPEGWLSNSS